MLALMAATSSSCRCTSAMVDRFSTRVLLSPSAQLSSPFHGTPLANRFTDWRPLSSTMKTRHQQVAFISVPALSSYSTCFSATTQSRRIPTPISTRDSTSKPTLSIPRSIKDYNTNRYDRFRSCLLSVSNDDALIAKRDSSYASFNNAIHDANNLINVARCTMEVLSSNRRSFNKTWARMSPLVELIVSACNKDDGKNDERSLQSIADVGCDHGILSLSLACMAWATSQRREQSHHTNFLSSVVGADLSSQALRNGGLLSLEKINAVMSRLNINTENHHVENTLPIEFRVGNGLDPLIEGEADGVALAGMGVHTMLDILVGTNYGQGNIDGNRESQQDDVTPNDTPIDRLQTSCLFLQPTNSRPRHLILLYDRLYKSGYVLKDEKIAFVSGRWYICSFLERLYRPESLESEPFRFPGHYLNNSVDEKNNTYDAYVRHHVNWLKQDHARQKESLEDEDIRWIEYLMSAKDDDWKSLAAWMKLPE
jgi:tRNA A22 N-methylase